MDAVRTLKVYLVKDGHPEWVGTLECKAGPKYVFTYREGVPPDNHVSLTMPVRRESYVNAHLHPVFQMNVPEGRLRDFLRQRFGKLMNIDDMGLLAIVGKYTLGRVRFTPEKEDLQTLPSVPLVSRDTLDEGAQTLFNDLMDLYAASSGVSGVQDKVLAPVTEQAPGERVSVHTRETIIKTDDGEDWPCLALNEYYCLLAAERAGLPVASATLSADKLILIVDRFDLDEQCAPRGFEDFCSLTNTPAELKYARSIEKTIKIIRNFIAPVHRNKAMEDLFGALVLNNLVRNGDAHLKNFAVIYDKYDDARLAPLFDIVTTTVYEGLRNDIPALSLGGRKAWMTEKDLVNAATQVFGLTQGRARAIIARVSSGVEQAAVEVAREVEANPHFRKIGMQMLHAWSDGIKYLVSKKPSERMGVVTSIDELPVCQSLPDDEPVRSGRVAPSP